MLELNNVSITLKLDERKIVENLSLTVKRGEKAVIIGEEGNGKSTLLKYIYNPMLAEGYCKCSGKVIAHGRTAYLPQMLETGDYEKTLSEFFENTEYYLYPDVLVNLGLTTDFIMSDRKLGELSGGERIKMQLARLLMDEPDILLLDEPTNDLDLDTLEWLQDFIARSKLTVIYISHDETLIENTATTILHMEQLIRKTICRFSVARCSYREYLSFRRGSFEHQEQVAQKQRDDFDRKIERWRRIRDKVEYEQKSISRGNPSGGRLLKKKMHSVLAMGRRFEKEKENLIDFPEEEEAILIKFDEGISLPTGKTVLDLSLDVLEVGDRVLSRDIRLFVAGGEHIGIIGNNGTGKTTLLEHIRRELEKRRDITVGYMPQDYTHVLDFEQSPIEFLAENGAKADVTRGRTYMGSMKFTSEEMTGKVAALSGGQRAKLILLKMVLTGANVLLLDEPTRNFSPLSAPVVRSTLQNFGGVIISVSHDRKYLSEVCDKIYGLKEDGLFLLRLDD